MVEKLRRYRVNQLNTIFPVGLIVYEHIRQDLDAFIAVSTLACGKGTPYYMFPTDLVEWPYDELDGD